MREQIELMLSLQEGVNSIIDEQWRSRGNAWHRAIWMECAEILEREGDWKWWKAAPQWDDETAYAAHLEQQQIELCDIWHFALSWALQEGTDSAALLPPDSIPKLSKHAAIEAMVKHAVDQNLAAFLPIFYANCAVFELSFHRLFELYIGKNVVNRFRQDRGYKQGHYQKVFDGKEDNEHLSEIMAELGDVDVAAWPDELYSRLAQRYDAARPA